MHPFGLCSGFLIGDVDAKRAQLRFHKLHELLLTTFENTYKNEYFS